MDLNGNNITDFVDAQFLFDLKVDFTGAAVVKVFHYC